MDDSMERPSITVGVISDTHGLVRPEALAALQDTDLIVHAGDIGSLGVLDALGQLAPVHAVRGNVDRGPWAVALPSTLAVPAGGVRLYLLHRLADLDVDPAAEGFAAVISGHSHAPHMETRNGVLYLNPGSAGPRRFRLPVALATLRVEGSTVSAELMRLNV
ncbi:MAG: metallophosphoesterase family protein [Dehalococcoidia bacterium]